MVRLTRLLAQNTLLILADTRVTSLVTTGVHQAPLVGPEQAELGLRDCQLCTCRRVRCRRDRSLAPWTRRRRSESDNFVLNMILLHNCLRLSVANLVWLQSSLVVVSVSVSQSHDVSRWKSDLSRQKYYDQTSILEVFTG